MDFINNVKSNSWGQSVKKYPDEYNKIIDQTNFLTKSTISERFYCIVNDIKSIKQCYCGKEVKFDGFNKGYRTFCSAKCSANNKQVKDKRKVTCIEKYGTENVYQSEEVKSKSKRTLIDKYGVDNISKSNLNKNKLKNISLEKYGHEYIFQSEQVKEKIKNTLKSKYDVDNISQCKKNQEKKKLNHIKKYGVDHQMKRQEVVDKIKEYWRKEIGLETNLQLPEIRNKAISSNKKTKTDNAIYSVSFPESLEFLEKVDKKYKIHCSDCDDTFEAYHQYLTFRINNKLGICPNCNKKIIVSSFEKQILDFIKNDLYVDNIIENDRTVIKPKELDIYLPDYNLAIECNGIYWHSEKFVGRDYHLNKLKLCNDKDIRLIQIFEDEWINKKDIVKSRLKNLLYSNKTNRIHARKCQIKEISSKQKNQFLNQYHLQGSDKSSILLGAFYDDELVSVMTFSTGNISKGSKSITDIFELNRFCSNSDYHIPGIASKLFKHFISNYTFNTIYSYADLRWSDGNLYSQLGFELDSVTKPNYWYIVNNKRMHRFNFRKSSLKEYGWYSDDLTEFQITDLEGIHRIWDCGNLKFTYKKQFQI